MASATSDIELRSRQSSAGGDLGGGDPSVPDDVDLAPVLSRMRSRHEFELPPVDGGKDAWLFLAACFTLEALVWGFPFSFGLFQDYYSTHEPFRGSSNIAIIGTCAMGIMYLDVPIIMSIQRRYPAIGRWSPLFGVLVMCLSLGLSSLSTSVAHLIVCQGIFYAVGGSICYSPCILYMDEWFARRKGLAYGIMWSGTGLAGLALPLVLSKLLDSYGFRTTLRIWAVALFVLSAPLSYCIKPRLPPSAHSHVRKINLRFLFSRAFLLHESANIIEALGFFLPGIYLPSYASTVLGAKPVAAAGTVLALNVASVFGCVLMGSLIDRLHVTTCLLLSTAGATIGVFFLWGFATSLPVLYAFCVIYGFFAGSYTSTWPGIMRGLTTTSTADNGSSSGNGIQVDATMVFAFLAFGRGVGNVLAGPLSSALMSASWSRDNAGGYSSSFGSVIVFTGVTALLGGTTFLWRRVGWL